MKCKKCNNELIEYRAGQEIEYICPICDESPATQIDNLIEYDTNMYIVKILPSNEMDKELLKEVSKICECNILAAKEILAGSGKEFNKMDALDTRELKSKLDSSRIKYVITPEFKW